MKKTLAILLAAIMTSMTFSSCSNKSGSNADVPQPLDDPSQQEAYTVKALIPGDATTEATKLVSEEATKILKEKFNTTMDITAVGFGSYPNQVNLMLSSGEKLDIMYNNRDIFVSAINSGQITDITPYLETYGKDLLEQIPQERLACTSLGGKVYAIPANKEVAVSWGVAFDKAMADSTGVDYSNIKKEEDLLPLLQAVKQKYPDVWPLVAEFGGMSTMNTNDDLGADIGSLLDATNPSDTTVINYYESDEFREICERRYDWAQQGLIIPDASSTSEASNAQIASGKGFARFTNTKPGIKEEIERQTNKEMVVITLTDVYTTTTRLDILWYVAHNSEKPERAVQVLNEMYTNADLANTLIYGIEGTHYEIKDEANGIVGYPEGVDATNSGYPANPWSWPNEMISYIWDGPANLWEDTDKWNKEAIVSPAMGFTWDNSNVLNQVTSCKNVKTKYENALVTGSINPDEAIPQFIKELKEAGVEDIIKEKQTQLDEYLASK